MKNSKKQTTETVETIETIATIETVTRNPHLSESYSTLENSHEFINGSGIRFKHPCNFTAILNSIENVTGSFTNLGTVEKIGEAGTDHELVAYKRLIHQVDIQSPFPGFDDKNTFSIGLLYALDTPNPHLALYAGEKVHACLNTHVFGNKGTFRYDFLKSKGDLIKQINDFIQEQLADMQRVATMINRLKTETVNPYNELSRIMEQVLRHRERLGTTYLIQGMQNLTDPKCKYYLEESKQECTKYHLLNAITENFKKDSSDILIGEKSATLTNYLLN